MADKVHLKQLNQLQNLCTWTVGTRYALTQDSNVVYNRGYQISNTLKETQPIYTKVENNFACPVSSCASGTWPKFGTKWGKEISLSAK